MVENSTDKADAMAPSTEDADFKAAKDQAASELGTAQAPALAGDGCLIDFIEQVSGGAHLRVEENLGNGYVKLRTEEAERRQAKHDIRNVEDAVVELLRNARDAEAEKVFIATIREGDRRILTVLDDGIGIPVDLQETIFDARVTSKLETMIEDDWGVHGRGMALYSIKSNVSSARVVSSAPGLGSSFRLDIDTGELAEKSDQSTFPSIKRDDDGQLYVARGPKNILRTAAEFTLAHPNRPLVYIGSPSEVVATMHEQAMRTLSSDTLLFTDDPSVLPVTQRLACASDAADLMLIAASLGLDISERTAHRVLAGQIASLSDLSARTHRNRQAQADHSQEVYRDNRGLKLAAEDIEAFSREMEKAFEQLAKRYYISLTDLPRIQVKGDVITVRFPIEKD
ncbi:MAG: ATP-binding protein [Coriobacteriia bacterium]|nr:ATP-binding protein [Coriobacteriia bacterium]